MDNDSETTENVVFFCFVDVTIAKLTKYFQKNIYENECEDC